ncbi:hypothetical protein BDB00DRAFT_879578 [Zychaea mexicana]|uniref:uncharacterized protein n=1 Tax=Zychaea mexicana TaxID=64656 RepID=UPI0022FE3571|nr:uncharacterized protein BDB00DRAFT_879578 [Zychaea mexicana]KAI9476630.1 hypothetical protein BDB00DRAFT_879578 [Zychaea mexicana]
MSSPPFVLPRLSGSTLEPTCEPIVMYPPHIHQKEPLVYHKPVAAAAAMGRILATATPAPSLRRKNRPTFIDIPAVCKEFVFKEPDHDDFSAWSYNNDDEAAAESEPELLWDEVNQCIYKSASKRAHSISSVSSDGSPFFPPC